MPFGLAIPLLAQGIGAIFGGIGKHKAANADAENQLINIRNRIQADILQRKNFDPNQPFGTLSRGRLFGAIAKAWGLDDIVGQEIIGHIGQAKNVPGTEAIGGARYMTDPRQAGLPGFEKPKTGGSLALAIGDIFGGSATALSGLYPSGGGGGGGEDWTGPLGSQGG